MLSVGLVPGLKSVASATIAPASISSRAGRVVRQAEVKAAARQHRADDIGKCERVDVTAVDLLEMVGAGCLQLDREARGAGVSELLGVNSRNQSARAAGRKNSARLLHRERAPVAKNVAELGQARGGHCRNPAARKQIHVSVRATLKFLRDNVGSEKRSGDVERLLLMQLAQDRQDFELALPVEAVAALGLKRRRAVRCEFAEVRERAILQRFRGRAAQVLYRGANSTARTRDLLVSGARDALFVLSCPACGKYQMGVRVDEARQNHASAEVESFGASSSAKPFDSAARADGGDPIVANQ